MKHIIEFPDGVQLRPGAIIVDGVRYSADLFYEKHGYNWRTSAGGNILYFKSESGENIAFKQMYLLNYTREK